MSGQTQFANEQILNAPIERVEQVYWNFEYCPRKYRELGLKDVQVVSSQHDGDDYEITCDFKMKPSISVPKIAQKFVGDSDWLEVRQSDIWNTRTRSGRLEIDIKSFKGFVSITADMQLEDHPQGAVNRMAWTIECRLPLVGRKLSAYLADDIQSKFADDCRVANLLIQDM